MNILKAIKSAYKKARKAFRRKVRRERKTHDQLPWTEIKESTLASKRCRSSDCVMADHQKKAKRRAQIDDMRENRIRRVPSATFQLLAEMPIPPAYSVHDTCFFQLLPIKVMPEDLLLPQKMRNPEQEWVRSTRYLRVLKQKSLKAKRLNRALEKRLSLGLDILFN